MKPAPSKRKSASIKKDIVEKSGTKLCAANNLEESLSNTIIPKDLALPKDYEEYHTSEFIDGVKHVIKIDPSLYPIVVHANFKSFRNDKVFTHDIERYWYGLIKCIIGQKISIYSAMVVENKFKQLFDNNRATISKTLTLSVEDLKNVGLTTAKSNYILELSKTFNNPSHKLTQLEFYQQDDLDVLIKELCKIKGIGPWSAKMFAIFSLGNMNLFTIDDLAVARGMATYLKSRPKVLSEVQVKVGDSSGKTTFKNDKNSKRSWIPIHDDYVIHIAESFSPYKTVFLMILWRLSSSNIDSLLV